MAGRCAELGCAFIGERMICWGDGCYASGEELARHARCGQHAVEHDQNVHGIAPVQLFCTGCKTPLGTFTDTRSRAGAPWCGKCPKWWFE